MKIDDWDPSFQKGNEGKRSAASVRDAINRLSRTKFMASDIIVKYNDVFNNQIGNLLGSMKATLDTLPDTQAMHQKVNNVPLNEWIKEQVDELVVSRLLTYYHKPEKYVEAMEAGKQILEVEISVGTPDDEEYTDKLLARLLPKGVDKFVQSFALAYNATFNMLANEAGVKVTMTDPLTQDICRNWEYFWLPETKEYRLDGKYVRTYDGDKEVTQALNDGDCFTEINKGVYEALKNVKRT